MYLHFNIDRPFYNFSFHIYIKKASITLNKIKMKKTAISLFLFSMFLAISCQQSEIAQPKSKTKNARNGAALLSVTEVVPLVGSANGFTYEAIAIAFARWIFGPAFNDSPLSDPDGSRHVAGLQPVPGIMILSSNFGGESIRSVTIPANSYIFLPVFGVTSWKYESGDDPCDHSKIPVGHPLYSLLTASLKSYINNQKSTGLFAQVDGINIVPDITKFSIITNPFSLIVNNDFNNTDCDYTGKISTAIGHNFGIIIKLKPGPHTIIFSGITNNKQFYSGVTWNVIVEE